MFQGRQNKWKRQSIVSLIWTENLQKYHIKAQAVKAPNIWIFDDI